MYHLPLCLCAGLARQPDPEEDRCQGHMTTMATATKSAASFLHLNVVICEPSVMCDAVHTVSKDMDVTILILKPRYLYVATYCLVGILTIWGFIC